MPARARSTDPSSSHDAGLAIESAGILGHQQASAVAAVRAFPGRTSNELSVECGQDRYALARRLPECEDAGRVRRGDIRLDHYTKRPSVTWWPVNNTREV